MLKFLFILPLTLIGMSLSAQQKDIVPVDSIVEEGAGNMRLLIAPSYSFNQFSGTIASFASLSVAISFNDHIEAGFLAAFNFDNFEKQIIFPQNFQYNQFNFGVYGQYIFLRNKIRPLAGMALIYNLANWRSDGEAGDKFTDNIFVLKFYGGVVWEISDIFSFQVNAGYNIPGEVELISFVREDYRGFSGDIILKINISRF